MYFLSSVVRLQRHCWHFSIWTDNSQNHSHLWWEFHSALTTDHFFSDVPTVCQEFQCEFVVMPTNGMTNGEDHNGIGLAANPLKHHFVAPPSRLVADGPFSIPQSDLWVPRTQSSARQSPQPVAIVTSRRKRRTKASSRRRSPKMDKRYLKLSIFVENSKPALWHFFTWGQIKMWHQNQCLCRNTI